ncbi:MAG: hypothetical protein ACSHYA_17210 [Opitutaceae bacterium]
MPSSKEIESLVIETVRLLAEDFELTELSEPTVDSKLYGNDGILDSMALVNLIADLEDAVSEAFGASITLADEKAMSSRNSPFLTVSSISKAIGERISV